MPERERTEGRGQRVDNEGQYAGKSGGGQSPQVTTVADTKGTSVTIYSSSGKK